MHIDESAHQGRLNERSSFPILACGGRGKNCTKARTRAERGTIGRRSQQKRPYVTQEERLGRARLTDRRPLRIAVADLGRMRHRTVAAPTSDTGHHRTRASEVWKMTVGPEDPGQ